LPVTYALLSSGGPMIFITSDSRMPSVICAIFDFAGGGGYFAASASAFACCFAAFCSFVAQPATPTTITAHIASVMNRPIRLLLAAAALSGNRGEGDTREVVISRAPAPSAGRRVVLRRSPRAGHTSPLRYRPWRAVLHPFRRSPGQAHVSRMAARA